MIIDKPVEAIPLTILRPETAPAMLSLALPKRTRVVITGMGLVTPIGNTVEDFWRNALAGRSGVGKITRIDTTPFATHIGAEVKDLDLTQFMDRKEARRMARCSQLAIVAAKMAVQDARLNPIDPDRTGVIIGTAVGGVDVIQEGLTDAFTKGWRTVSPFSVGGAMPNAPAFHISLIFGARGYNATICTACASGTQAIGEAAEVIRRGAADVILAGGTECAITQTAFSGFGQMRVLSTRNEEPEKASRPFDKLRDGIVLGEGSGVLVLESLEHARQRGAPIYAEIVGSAAAGDAFHVTQSDPQGAGAARAIRWALDNAHLVADDIDYISAHATSTRVGDAAEVVAIKAIFGERAYSIPISSLKSLVGHTIGASGAIEAIACVLTLRDQQVHPTVNQEEPDPECDLDFVPNAARAAHVDVILSSSFGLGGQNACLILRKFNQ